MLQDTTSDSKTYHSRINLITDFANFKLSKRTAFKAWQAFPFKHSKLALTDENYLTCLETM